MLFIVQASVFRGAVAGGTAIIRRKMIICSEKQEAQGTNEACRYSNAFYMQKALTEMGLLL